jgi:hypothetical protein
MESADGYFGDTILIISPSLCVLRDLCALCANQILYQRPLRRALLFRTENAEKAEARRGGCGAGVVDFS